MVEGRVFGSVIDVIAIPCFGLRMYRRSVLRSDHFGASSVLCAGKQCFAVYRMGDCAGCVTAPTRC